MTVTPPIEETRIPYKPFYRPNKYSCFIGFLPKKAGVFYCDKFEFHLKNQDIQI